MSYCCPKCNRIVYNRHLPTCGYCGAPLPPEYLLPPSNDPLDKAGPSPVLQEDSDRGPGGQRDFSNAKSTLRLIVCALFSLFLLVTGVIGLYAGHIQSLGRHSHHTYVKASDPEGYWWCETAYFALGGILGGFVVVRIVKGRD